VKFVRRMPKTVHWISYTYSVEHNIGLFYLRLTCMIQVSALSQAIIGHVNTKII